MTAAGGDFWVGIESPAGSHSVVRVDAVTGRVLNTIEVDVEAWQLATTGKDVWLLGASGIVQHVDTGAGRVVAETLLPPPLSDLGVIAVGEGSVWVTAVDSHTFAGDQPLHLGLVRIDPETDEIVATIELGPYAPRGVWDIGVGGGAVWLAAPAGADCGTLIKVDVETNEVEFAVEGSADAVAVGPTGVWTSCKLSRNRYTIQRIDPGTGGIAAGPSALPSGSYTPVGSDDSVVWLTGYDEEEATVALRVDLGGMTETLPVAPALHTGSAYDADTRSIWVATVRGSPSGPKGMLVAVPAN